MQTANKPVTTYKPYSTWYNMMFRTTNPKCAEYHHYGGRSIKVCEKLSTLDGFNDVLGLRPSKTYSLDRKDPDGHYSCGDCNQCLSEGLPLNVRWTDINTQRSNIRPRGPLGYKNIIQKKDTGKFKVYYSRNNRSIAVSEHLTLEEAIVARNKKFDELGIPY